MRVYTHTCVCLYTYIYIERERERERHTHTDRDRSDTMLSLIVIASIYNILLLYYFAVFPFIVFYSMCHCAFTIAVLHKSLHLLSCNFRQILVSRPTCNIARK